VGQDGSSRLFFKMVVLVFFALRWWSLCTLYSLFCAKMVVLKVLCGEVVVLLVFFYQDAGPYSLLCAKWWSV
jgi:hypothetical protein